GLGPEGEPRRQLALSAAPLLGRHALVLHRVQYARVAVDHLGRALGGCAYIAAEQTLVLGALVVEAGVVCLALVDQLPVEAAAAAVADGVRQDGSRVTARVVHGHAWCVDRDVGAVEVGVGGGAAACS